jgi:hypothetical protein
MKAVRVPFDEALLRDEHGDVGRALAIAVVGCGG